jgi:Peptidase family M48
MLYLTLLMMTLVTSQSLEMEVSRIVEEYLSQVDLEPSQYEIVISDQVPEGAALVHWVEASGKDTAVFLFERELLLQLSRRETRVLIAHEVAHLALECQLQGRRIYQELCADVVSLKFVPVDDVAAMLAKSIVSSPYYPAQRELIYRLGVIQANRTVTGELELKAARRVRLPPENIDGLYCE